MVITKCVDEECGVRFEGELDVAATDGLEERLTGLAGSKTVRIDVSGLEFIDASGVGVLVRARQALAGRGTRLMLVGPTGTVLTVLESLELTDLIETGPSG